MNKRKRKKWLKKNNLYVNPKDTWNLDVTFAEFILPRLKLFKKLNNGYPGIEEADTPEKWDQILDKIILTFEYIIDEDWWINDPKYDYSEGLHLKTETNENNFRKVVFEEEDWVQEKKEKRDKEEERRKTVIKEGLELFTKWYQHLWW